MKKGLFLTVVFSLLFGTVSYASIDVSGLYNRPYNLYVEASAALREAESSILSTEMDMTIDIGGEELSYSMAGTVSEIHTDPSDVQMQMDMAVTGIPGLEQNLVMYYRDGFSYMELMGMKVKQAMPIDEFLESGSGAASADSFEFPAEYIKSQSMKNTAGGKKEVSFVVDSALMSGIPIEDIASLAGTGNLDSLNLEIGDIAIKALIDAEGAVESLNMIFTAGMTVMEVDASVDYDITMGIVQLGGVTIEYPDDLDTYMDISTLSVPAAAEE